MIDRCSADESGTELQQIYAAIPFSKTKTYNIELKVHSIAPNYMHWIGILVLDLYAHRCSWRRHSSAVTLYNSNNETSSDPGV